MVEPISAILRDRNVYEADDVVTVEVTVPRAKSYAIEGQGLLEWAQNCNELSNSSFILEQKK